jgi:hypothetical protein
VPPPLASVLVIGAYREELPFGEQVTAGLTDEPIETLRIPVGISGRVRLTLLVAADGSGLAAYAGGQSRPLGRALIPHSVGAMQEPVYVAVKVFLRECGSGGPDDWNLARELIRPMLK